MNRCRSCSAPLPEASRFCPSCGATVLTEEGGGVRKLVTILVSDVVGSTTLAERMDPEALGRIMMAYFSEMNAILRRHGGVPEKYIGDAVLAVFGFPSVHEDDALRACRAALDMRAALARLNERFQATWGARLETRTGVNTGEVVAASPTRDQTLPLGDPANVAARLESAASPGEIYIGETTWRLVRPAVQAKPLEPLTLKGKGEPVRAWRLVRILPADASALPGPLASPLVGRDAELAMLTELFDTTVRDRSCRLATVIGEPGVGKSRLVLEFLTRLEGRARILRGRCLSYGEGITFWPLAETLKEASFIEERDSPEEAIASLDRMLAGLDDRDRVVPLLASALGWMDSSVPIEEVFWAARMALEHLAKRSPVVVWFDDLHWAEQRFLDLLEHIARYSSGSALLLMCTARPELLEERPQWEREPAGHTIVQLASLSEESSSLLAAGLLDASQVPPSIERALVETAEGNPLFIEQLIRAWIDEGVLAGSDGSWRFTADPRSLAVPPSLRSLLQSRLERLTPDHRALLERAAVIGQVFQRTGLLELADAPALEVKAGLESLAARGFIEAYIETSAPEPSYRFHHVLLRDSAYEGSLKARRASLHERFGAWLRQSVGPRLMEYEELVGYHFEQGYRYLLEIGDPDGHASALAREAFDHLSAAGRRALAREDANASVNLLSRAETLLPDSDAARLALLPDLGDALSAAGDPAAADAVLRETIEAAMASGDQLLEARATIPWLWVQAFADPTWLAAHARRHVERILPTLEATGDETGLAGALEALATEPMNEGRFDEAEALMRQVILHAGRAGARRQEAATRAWLCSTGFWGPTPVPEAIDRCRETMVWAQQAPGAQGCVGRVLRVLGVLDAMAKRFKEGRKAVASSASIMQKLGLPGDWAVTQIFAGEVEVLAQRPDTAYAILDGARASAQPLGAYAHGVTLRLAEAALMLDRIDEADRFTRESSSWQEMPDRENAAEWRATRARVLARLGRAEEAEALAREAVTMIEGTGFLVRRGTAHQVLADVLLEAGRDMEAHLEFRRALALFEEKGDLARATALRDVMAARNDPVGLEDR